MSETTEAKKPTTAYYPFLTLIFTTIVWFACLLKEQGMERRIESLERRANAAVASAITSSTPATSTPTPAALLTQDFDIIVEYTGEPVQISALTAGGTTIQCSILAYADVTSCRIHALFETRRVGGVLDTRIFRFQVRRGNTEATMRSGTRCFENPAMRFIRGYRTDNGFGFYAEPSRGLTDGSDPGDCNLVVRYEQVESADPNESRDAYLAERRRHIEWDRHIRESEQRLQQLGIAPSVRPTSL